MAVALKKLQFGPARVYLTSMSHLTVDSNDITVLVSGEQKTLFSLVGTPKTLVKTTRGSASQISANHNPTTSHCQKKKLKKK
jgi:hypothetical protein